MAAACRVQIKHRLELQFGNGKPVQIPDDLLVEDLEGKTYLKLRPTSQHIAKLICNDCPKNASLSSFPRLLELKQKRNDKLVSLKTSESDEQPAKKKKLAEQVLEVEVDGCACQILVPGKRAAQSDLAVALDADQLNAVLGYLEQDCDQLKHTMKRKYEASGRYRKNDQGQGEPSEED